jgi:hypothetical protein
MINPTMISKTTIVSKVIVGIMWSKATVVTMWSKITVVKMS